MKKVSNICALHILLFLSGTKNQHVLPFAKFLFHFFLLPKFKSIFQSKRVCKRKYVQITIITFSKGVFVSTNFISYLLNERYPSETCQKVIAKVGVGKGWKFSRHVRVGCKSHKNPLTTISRFSMFNC